MRIGIVGAGRIGGNAARLFAKAGHEVLVSFSRDQQKLEALAAEIGGRAGTPREAVVFGVVFLAMAVTFRSIWLHAQRSGKLAALTPAQIAHLDRRNAVGLTSY